jgi:hypothetical protein
MQTVIVRPKSRLIGETCLLCPEQVKAGHAVAWAQLGATHGRTKAVFHVECLAAEIEDAPVGRPVRNVAARFRAARRRMRSAA